MRGNLAHAFIKTLAGTALVVSNIYIAQGIVRIAQGIVRITSNIEVSKLTHYYYYAIDCSQQYGCYLH